ncbi:Serine/threonine-protein kinase smg1 [Coemansia spiralis]|nr:Serine/threonine-protein kinase smg1 [Coemansia spiralis]
MLGELMGAAAQLELSPALASTWASELPAAAARLHSTGGDAVLRGDEACHLLLHLVDIALSKGALAHGAALDSLGDAAAALSQHCYSATVPADDGAVWTAVVNLGGMVVARHIHGADDGSVPAAVRLVRAVVAKLGELPAATQCAALALVYTLYSKIGARADACIVDVVAQCTASACCPQTRHSAGQMLLESYGSGGTVPAAAVDGILALAGDCDHRVRAVWSRLAGRVTAAMPLSLHPFAALQQRLCDDRGTAHHCLDAQIHGAAGTLSLADAMLVVEALCDSIAAYTPSRPDHDCGLVPAALRIVETTRDAMEPDMAAPGDIYTAIAVVVAATGCRLGAADSSWAVAIRLLAAVETQLTTSTQREPAPAVHGVYWATELVFHLCKPGTAGALLLLQDPVKILLLSRAAATCHNTALAVYVAQLAAAGSAAQADARQQLAPQILWRAVSQAACCGAGDAVDAMAGACLEPSTVAGDRDIAVAAAAAMRRLGRFDDGVARAGGFDELRYSRLLFGCGPAAAERLVCPVADSGIAGRFLRLRPLRIAAGMVEPTHSGPLAQLWPPAASDSVAWAELSDLRKLACVAACVSSGLASASTAAPTLDCIAGGQLGPQDAALWRAMRAAAAITVAYETSDVASAMAALSVSGTATPLDSDAHFALILPEPHSSIVGSGAGLTAPCDLRVDSSGEPDPTVAREALLCHYAGQPHGKASGQVVNELFTQVLQDGRGQIQLTATGAFDAASCLVAQMATRPQDAPRLLATTLTASAVRQLAPYIPQLLAMLCAPSGPPEDGTACTARDSAYGILELLAACAPDTVALHVVVASRSHPPASMARQLAGALLRLLPADQTAAIGAFLACVTRIAVLPHERMQMACQKARAAHAKVLAAHQSRPETAAAGLGAALQQPLDILAEYSTDNSQMLLSPAEREFAARIPQLRALLGRLQTLDDLQTGDLGPEHGAGQLWAELSRALATAPTLSLDHVCPALAELTDPVPIPVLGDPAEPVYFAGASSDVRIIGSKTRPKLLTLHVRTGAGAVVQDRYIVKGNEDIRIDESVMQTFVRLNRVAAAGGPATAGRQQTLAVYNVVPIGACGGLIQVVDGSQSLFAVYTQHAAATSAAADTQRTARPPGLHQMFAHCAQPVLRDAGLPTTLPFAEWPEAVAGRVYESLCRAVPPDLLYVRLARVAQHSAHLYRLSRSVARSIGMASAAGYLLGLGDRHLDNLLLDIDRGQLVQIDFNVSYDFGGVSHIPEQVPFRMTPMLAYLCDTPDHVDALDGRDRLGTPLAHRPFAMSRVFLGAATAVLQFARMDRVALADAIVSRALFQPFAEWCWIEESWLRDPEQHRARQDMAARLLAQPPPRRLLAADISIWARPQSVSVDEFVRRTGLNPSNAFWPRDPGPETLPTPDAPHGWRLAHAAVGRVRARLAFCAAPGDTTLVDTVERQMMVAWEAATDTGRLARMYSGWAPWL